MRSITNEKNLKGTKILLRLDLNVPLEKGEIIDTTRIDKVLPTLNNQFMTIHHNLICKYSYPSKLLDLF